VAGWIWRLYHATGDGRLFNYPVQLSSSSPLAKTYTNTPTGTPTRHERR
jgi:hypothetical protein